MLRIAHLQPCVPHYREEFFFLIGKQTEQDIYTFENVEASNAQEFFLSKMSNRYIHSKHSGGILLYDPWPMLRGKYDVLVLMLHFGHLTTWLLLLTKWIHHRKIILWGQGISVKRYLKEERKSDWKLRLMLWLADGAWLYTKKELYQWQKVFPSKPMVALGNTLTGVHAMTEYTPVLNRSELRAKYGISHQRVLIFCARFENNFRRVDLLEETISRLDPNEFAFVIIGAGKHKPNFANYVNVRDFGALYDADIKRELFALSDIYFQPGWVGLSIVEAMAYGKPVFTFKRSRDTMQCVEYSYIQHGYNGMILNDIDHAVNTIQSCSNEVLQAMGRNAREYVRSNLTMTQMALRGMEVLEALRSEGKMHSK